MDPKSLTWWKKREATVQDLIKIFLEEALVQHRNGIMNSFSQILQQFPIVMEEPLSSGHFGDAKPFKVLANFGIHLLQG